MKRFTLIALLVLAAGSPDPLQAQTTPWTTETADELVSPGDFDGDGLLDVLIVDKPLGVVRLGWGRADGGLDWSDVRELALEHAGSLAVGRLQSTARDSFVVSGPDWNATYLYPGTRDAAWTAHVMTPPVFAPGAMAALEVGGAGNNPNLADLFVAGGDFDPATGEVRGASVRPDARVVVGESILDARQQHGHSARLTPSGQAATFAIVSATESVLTFWSALDTGPAPGLPLVDGLPPGSDFVQTALGTGQLTLFIFTPGQSVLIRQPLATATTLDVRTLHDLGRPIDSVVALQTPTLQTCLLVLFSEGASAYALDDAGTPVLRETFTPAEGTRFTAAASASGGGALRLLTGASGGGGTTGWQQWSFTDTAFTAGPSGTVPAVSRVAARRDVFFFSQEVFVEPTAQLVASAKAADWSTSVSAGSPVNARASQFLGGTQGLGPEANYALGPRPAGSSFGIPNQYANDISLSRLGGGGPTPPLGSVTFAPPPGAYAGGTLLYLVPPRPADAVFYRRDGAGAWLAYAGPLALSDGGLTLEAIARPAGTTQSTPTAHAVYVASAPPPLTAPPGSDANGNGLTDSWEDAFGVDDPNADPDHDTATNKQEHDAGTDPTNPANLPPVVATVLFDNLGGVHNGVVPATATTWQAGKFCLRAQPYQLDSVALELQIFDLTLHSSTVRLHIFSNDAASDVPSVDTGVMMSLAGMTNPITLLPGNSGTLVTWTPATPFTLAADTCYWAVFRVESGASVWQTASQTIPSGEASAKWRTSSMNSGATWAVPDNFATHKMLIRGTVSAAPQEFSITEVGLTGNTLQISFPALSGRSYVIESRALLVTGEWAEVPDTMTTGNGAPVQVTIPEAFTEPQQFYRVKQLP